MNIDWSQVISIAIDVGVAGVISVIIFLLQKLARRLDQEDAFKQSAEIILAQKQANKAYGAFTNVLKETLSEGIIDRTRYNNSEAIIRKITNLLYVDLIDDGEPDQIAYVLKLLEQESPGLKEILQLDD
jgi:Mg/Co/Ni transporter MgtE